MARGDLARLDRLAWIYRLFSALFGFFGINFLVRMLGPAVSQGNWRLAGCALVYSLIGLGWAAGLLAASFLLREGRQHGFCLTMAVTLLAFFPFGTAAGVWSISLLRRPSVRALFR